jgi:ATP/maltotriose-dependent transcriptional regulator MalT
MAIWLASDCIEFRGEVAVASGWRRRAARLLHGLPASPEHGWLTLHEGSAAIELDGDPVTARRIAVRAVRLGRRVGSLDVEMVGLAIEGLALVMQGQVARGMGQLDEATTAAAAGELTELVSVAWTCCYLVNAAECVGDFARATEWCRRIDELAQRLRFRYWRGVCRVHYAAAQTWQGEWASAERELVGASRDLAASRPPLVAEATVRLADLRLCQGRLDDAERLYCDAEDHPFAVAGLARIALERGVPRGAVNAIERLLRRIPPENRMRRAEALQLLIRAHVALGQARPAAAALRALRTIARTAATVPLRAAALRAEGTIAAAGGRQERARRCFEDAVDLFHQIRTPFASACARLDLAACLAALGTRDDAVREARAALAVLTRLGAGRDVRRARELLGRLARPDSPLTARECEVLAHVARGLGDKQVAAALAVSPHTVHRHVANVLTKLGVSSRAAAVAQAVARGLFAPWPKPAMPEAPRSMA